MSVIDKLARVQGIRNDVPNQTLAQSLATAENADAIREIVDNLHHKEKAIQSDCIKVLYEMD